MDGIMAKKLIRFAELNYMVICIRLKCMKIGILITSVLLVVLITPNSFADNYDRTYRSQVRFGLGNQELRVSVPSSLYEYYSGKTIILANDNDYSKLVTSDPVKPIAESLRNLTRDAPRSDEEFANAVLMLVHQIPYAASDIKYPVEVLVENSGKCDTLSLLAASIMKAGGLDVVLLYFKGAHHINVGVYLPYEPHNTFWWLQPTSYEFNGKKYWIAECTPAMNWKVGDVPTILEDQQPWIISLEDSEKSSPARVSSKLGSFLNSSSISINLSSNSSDNNDQERMLTISGSISPAYANESVTVYFSQDGISYNAGKTETDNWGNYSLGWNLNATGTYYIRAAWSGNADYAGADSETLTVFIGFLPSSIQFEGPYYNYIIGRASAATYELSRRQGVEEFLNLNLSGTGVILTGEFMILRSEQTISSVQTKTITIPKSEPTIEVGRRRQRFGATIPEQTITIPINIPNDMQPLRLPDDFSLTINNNFGFILRNNVGDNYSVTVRGMDDCDISQIKQLNGTGTVLMNPSANMKENTWYKVEARVSEDETTAALYDVNDTLLESATISYDKIDTSELVMLIANNTDRALVFKNLKVETLDELNQVIPNGDEKALNAHYLQAIYLAFAILLITTFSAVVRKKMKNSRSTTLSSKN
jgi:hypothetical protein